MLYVCATPIGNLQDITIRVLDTLARCDVVACEDTRRTRILLQKYDIHTKLVSFHNYNEEQRQQLLLPLLRDGKEVALVSDAGLPTLSDPGFSLVQACIAEGIPFTVLPGPSAVTTALVLAGFPAARFAFVGFLARGPKQLRQQLATFDGTGAAVVAFESPRRLSTSLAVIGERWPERQLAVCRELTKVHEEVVRGTASQVLSRLEGPVRGEIVLVLEAFSAMCERLEGAAEKGWEGGLPVGMSEERLRAVLLELVKAGVGTKVAAGIASQLTGLSSRQLYRLAVEVQRSTREGIQDQEASPLV